MSKKKSQLTHILWMAYKRRRSIRRSRKTSRSFKRRRLSRSRAPIRTRISRMARWKRSYKRGMPTRVKKWRPFRNSIGNRSAKIPSSNYPVTIVRGPASQRPARVRVVLPYTATYLLGNGAAQAAYNGFRLNGAFDPDYSIGGASPLGFTKYANEYARYVVHEAYVNININIRDTGAVTARAGNIIAGVHYSSYSTPASIAGFDTIEELETRSVQRAGGEKFFWRRMARAVSGYNTNIGPGGKIFMRPFKIKYPTTGVNAKAPYGKIATHTADVDADPYGISSDTAATPTCEFYFSIFAFSQYDTNLTNITRLPLPYTYFDIKIFYDVEFFSPLVENQA